MCRAMGVARRHARIDVGVAGLHRLAGPLDELRAAGAAVVVVAAGMEGALPSVVAGLVDVPVIGLPTSTGYGLGGRGEAALLGMLQSCSPGLVVVNIDNGIGAGATAALIARRASATDSSAVHPARPPRGTCWQRWVEVLDGRVDADYRELMASPLGERILRNIVDDLIALSEAEEYECRPRCAAARRARRRRGRPSRWRSASPSATSVRRLQALRGAVIDVLLDALVLDEMPSFGDTLDQLKAWTPSSTGLVARRPPGGRRLITPVAQPPISLPTCALPHLRRPVGRARDLARLRPLRRAMLDRAAPTRWSPSASRARAAGCRPRDLDDALSDGLDATPATRCTSSSIRAAPGLRARDGAFEPLDFAFPIMHGTFAEDGTIQGLLEIAGLPYAGAGVAASSVGMDKELMKAVFAAAGLPQVDYLVLRDEAATGPAAVGGRRGAPRLPGVRQAGQPGLERGHDQGPRPRRAGTGPRAGRRLRPQGHRRGGLRRPRARVQRARQRASRAPRCRARSCRPTSSTTTRPSTPTA